MNEIRKSASPRNRSRTPFRTRLFAILLLFAVIPSVIVTLAWVVTTSRTLPLIGATSAWDRVGSSGEKALSSLANADLTETQRNALQAHETELRRSVEMAKRIGFVLPRSFRLVAAGACVLLILVALGASRVAGHLARQMSRPVDELVGWTGIIRSGKQPPTSTNRKGAPEFEVLRSGMRTMAEELEKGRLQAIASERAEAFRESARRFAHELKNPLTPIRFAVDRLKRSAPSELSDTVDVLAEESARLDSMARSFAQFGRLPDGPVADVDMAELTTRAAQNIVPPHLTLSLNIDENLPLVRGHHDAIARALSNILINAVEISATGDRITVSVKHDSLNGEPAVSVSVKDYGPGMDQSNISRIFDPYFTTKPGGTGLGLAIASQTVAAHKGSIKADSSPEAGTCISICLPVSREEISPEKWTNE